MVQTWQAAPLALLAAMALSPAALASDPYFEGTQGCQRQYDGYTPEMVGFHGAEPDPDHCAARCNATSGCRFFMFESNTSTCRLAPWYATDANTHAMHLIAGMSPCVPRSPCKDYARNGFPGSTADLSNAAWVSGRPPTSTECWPKVGGSLETCLDLFVLEDAADPSLPTLAACSDLQQTGIVASSCEAECRASTRCSVWEVGADGTCFHGEGKHCFTPGAAATKGQRLMHGDVKVLMALRGIQITSGMSQAFDAAAVGPGGFFATGAEALAACKRVCYSIFDCEYWMFSADIGCWIEDEDQGGVPYPLTLAASTRGTLTAMHIEGEYVAHYCPSNETDDSVGADIWCLVHGTRWLPDMDGQDSTVEPDVERCQQRCVDTVGCARFSYYPDNQMCHLQDESASEGQDYAATSGLKTCPDESTAFCSDYFGCRDREGYCCPDKYGVRDPCCDAVEETPIHTQESATVSTADDGGGGGGGIEWWMVLILLLLLALCLLVVLFFVCRGKDDESEEEMMHHPLHDAAVYDRSKLPFPEAAVGVAQNIPFPEAGVRNPNLLPFPKAGLAEDFPELHPGVNPENVPYLS